MVVPPLILSHGMVLVWLVLILCVHNGIATEALQPTTTLTNGIALTSIDFTVCNSNKQVHTQLFLRLFQLSCQSHSNPQSPQF
jgi:hypothetical protein